MRSKLRLLSIAALSLAFVLVYADQASIRLSSYPTISVSDGHSTTAVYADVRDASGRPVPDGTAVLFGTSIGTFRENVVKTLNGKAYATLISGGNPGVAKITASAISVNAAPSVMDFEFVADRKLLSSAQEYVEIVAPGYMQYAADSRIVSASGANRGVSLRYRDIQIEADDLQLNIPTYEVKARNVRMKVGKEVREFGQLYFRLNLRRGFGTTTFKTTRWDTIELLGTGIQLVQTDDDGKTSIPPPQDRFGFVSIVGAEIRPTTEIVGNNLFSFDDLSGSPSTVAAKKAVIFPRKEIQFQKAEIYVGGAKVMKLPLFELNMYGNSSPLVTEQLVSVNDNQLAINYPYYLSMKPGQTSLLRFHTNDRYGRTVSGGGGAFLDYELNWDRGDDLEGNFTVGGLARSDWYVSARQYMRMGDATTAVFQGDMLSNRTLYGNANISHQFTGWQTSLGATRTQTLKGISSTFTQTSLVMERDPMKFGKLPIQGYIGFTSTQSQSSFGGSQEGTGVRVRAQTSSIPLDRMTSVSSSFAVSKLYGSQTNPGLTLVGNATISRRLSSAASMVLTYDYTHDGFNDALLGAHRIGLNASYFAGPASFSLYGSKSLGVDRMNLYGDMSYRLSGQWRLAYAYTFDKYLAQDYLDYNFVVGYRLGWREVGLTWSNRTKRVGFQLLGASF